MKLLPCLLLAGVAQAAPLPVEQFFQKPQTTGASISPDGRHVALRMMSPAGRNMLNVVDTETRAQKVVANFSNADVKNFSWLNDNRLAYSVINVDHGGDVGKPGLYAVDRDGKDFVALSETIEHPRSFADSDYASTDYLARNTINGFPTRKADSMFVMIRTGEGTSLGRINTRDGVLVDIRAPYGTYQWLTDPAGEVRVAVARRGGKEVVLIKQDKDWRELAAFDPLAADVWQPLLYLDGTLYVRAYNGQNEAAVYRYDLQNNAVPATPMISVPGFDANGYFLVDDQKMLGYRVNTDTETTVWFDPAMKALQKEVDDLLPGTLNTLSVAGHNATPQVLIDAHRDIQDHIYFLYNRDTKKLLKLGASRPAMDPDQMGPMAMERYTARDGMKIPVYVTFPNVQSGKPAPTVVLVGDPQWKRNGHWDWNAEVQFLASRGYVVLQPEPRGADGFGRAHETAGVKQWGRAIQDDIADAVKWATQQGYTDPARVCIAGTGYGGYAAMMGLLRDPGVFKCGVSWSGITDIGAMFERDWGHVAEPRALPQLRATIGDPKLDAAQLRDTSPLHNAARITQPVLLAYGKEDGRVPFSEGRKFYQALSAGNRNVEWLEYTPSVDDAKTQANRIDLWRHIEAFLAKQIAP